MITTSGAVCDVCDKHILPDFKNEEKVNIFTVGGILDDLHCHNACKDIVIKCTGAFDQLPEGRLRRAFIESLNIRN